MPSRTIYPGLLQEAGASLAAAIAVAALVGPAQVAARILEFWFMRHVKPITSHGAGNGVITIATGTLPLALFGAGSFGLRQGLLMMPARFLQAFAPFIFDLLLSRIGLGALAVTAAFGMASFAVLSVLRGIAPPPRQSVS